MNFGFVPSLSYLRMLVFLYVCVCVLVYVFVCVCLCAQVFMFEPIFVYTHLYVAGLSVPSMY